MLQSVCVSSNDVSPDEDLELVGLAEQLDSAEMLIQAHLDYREVGVVQEFVFYGLVFKRGSNKLSPFRCDCFLVFLAASLHPIWSWFWGHMPRGCTFESFQFSSEARDGIPGAKNPPRKAARTGASHTSSIQSDKRLGLLGAV